MSGQEFALYTERRTSRRSGFRESGPAAEPGHFSPRPGFRRFFLSRLPSRSAEAGTYLQNSTVTTAPIRAERTAIRS